MKDSVFTKIIKGDLPCHKVYEDQYVIAFLDIHPIVDGHTLVVPKMQVEFVWDLPEAEYAALMQAVQKVGRRLREVMPQQYVGQMVVGTDVPHTHIHLLPFNDSAELRAEQDLTKEPDHIRLAELAKNIIF